MTELFETFDDRGRPTGLVARHDVHARGLWHKSAHVFLFDDAGALWIQRRAAGKDLYPGRWDFSVGEHLQPGEDFHEAAVRGLREELGVSGADLEPWGDVHRSEQAVAGLGVVDRELQQAYRGTWTDSVTPAPAEVAAVRPLPLAELGRWMRVEPAAFTPWFLAEAQRLKLLAAVQNRPS